MMIVNKIYYILYVSAAEKLFSKEDLVDLLRNAREKNQRLGVTGMLLYKDGDFIQLLEGDREAVKTLFDTIKADPRHGGTMVLAEGNADERVFPDWSMGFRNLSDPVIQATPGYSQFMNTRLDSERFGEDPNGCLELLMLFKPNF